MLLTDADVAAPTVEAMHANARRVLMWPESAASATASMVHAADARRRVGVPVWVMESPGRCEGVARACGITPEVLARRLPNVNEAHRPWVYAHAWAVASMLVDHASSSEVVCKVLAQKHPSDAKVQRVVHVLCGLARSSNPVAAIAKLVLECCVIEESQLLVVPGDELIFPIDDM
jgi:hypothetical protein